MTANPSRNTLGDETSPYLQPHRDNPVHWQAWGPAALEAAKKEDKPILLSVGYAACHWCHVMAHESFENPAIAAAMNEHFVNIKVDREERPDIDAIYMHALHMMGEQGGWPLTMFLTPDGEPFWGGTYFPPTPRFGRPGFPQVLEAIGEAYPQGSRDHRQERRGPPPRSPTQLAAPQSGQAIDLALIDQVAARLAQEIDGVHGGIGQAPKFPQGPVIEVLWRAGSRGNAAARDAVLLTLDHIAQGGIYDHLGGGFARYSVDARWLAPHFEKMLYDNALLIDRYTAAYQATQKPLYAEDASPRPSLGSCAEMTMPEARLRPRASMPIASMSKASSMSGAQAGDRRRARRARGALQGIPTTSPPMAIGKKAPSSIASITLPAPMTRPSASLPKIVRSS